MKKTEGRRQLFFFSISLALHCLGAGVLLVTLAASHDTPAFGPGRSLTVTLSGDTRPGGTVTTHLEESRPTTLPERSVPTPGILSPGVPAPGRDDAGQPRDGGSGKDGGIGSVGGGGDPGVLADYIRTVRKKVERHKRYPLRAAYADIQGTVTVSFLLDARGALLKRSILISSGHPELDEAALTALIDASPFPPFPEGIDRDTILFRLPVIYETK